MKIIIFLSQVIAVGLIIIVLCRPQGDNVTFEVTAYCPCKKCCGVYADGIAASGYVITKGDKFCAAPPEYSFGTMIDIEGYGKVPVLDRGGAIKGNKLDVFFSSHQEALNWGRRKNVKCKVY